MRRLNPIAKRRPAKKNAAKRQRLLRAWAKPAIISISVFLMSGLLGGGGYWVFANGYIDLAKNYTHRQYLEVTADAGLAVRDVLVEGRQETTREQLMFAINAHYGDPMLGFDPQTARAQLQKLGWIADAIVERRFPETIYVRLFERKAMAIWQRNGRFVLVDFDGNVIGRDGLDRYGHLKVIVGDEAPKRAAELLQMTQSVPELHDRVTAAVWVGGRRWNIRLEDKIDIRLPETNPEAAWAQLAVLQRKHGLLGRDILAVDMRIPDQLIIRTKSGVTKKRRVKDQPT